MKEPPQACLRRLFHFLLDYEITIRQIERPPSNFLNKNFVLPWREIRKRQRFTSIIWRRSNHISPACHSYFKILSTWYSARLPRYRYRLASSKHFSAVWRKYIYSCRSAKGTTDSILFD